MRSLAFGLVLIGVAVLVYGVITYSSGHHTIEMGSMSASITENGAAPMTAMVVGGIALVAGLILLSADRRRV